MLIFYIIIVTSAVSFTFSVIENQIKKQPTKGYNLGYIISAVVGSLVGGLISMVDAPWLIRLGSFSSPILWVLMGAMILSGILLVIRFRRIKTKKEPSVENKAK